MARKKSASIDREQIHEFLVGNYPPEINKQAVLDWRDKAFKSYKGKQGQRRPADASLKKVIRESVEAILHEGATIHHPEHMDHIAPNWAKVGENYLKSQLEDVKAKWKEQQRRANNLSNVRTLFERYNRELNEKEGGIIRHKKEIGQLEARVRILRERTARIENFLNDSETITICDWLKEQQL